MLTSIKLAGLLYAVVLVASVAKGQPTPNRTSAGATNQGQDNSFAPEDYLSSDEEFEQLLRRLQEEAEQAPIKEDSRNYLGDNADMEQILAMIEQSERAQQEQQTQVGQVSGRPTSELRSTPELRTGTFLRPTNLNDDTDNECPICYEPKEDAATERLACGHEFHEKCLHDWARAKHQLSSRIINCPLCRRPQTIRL